MSSQQCEPGEGWDKAFRRAIVAGGPLKGARFTDVGWNDLKKAAKQYKADPRFMRSAASLSELFLAKLILVKKQLNPTAASAAILSAVRKQEHGSLPKLR